MPTAVPPSAPSRVRRRIFLAFLVTLAAGAALVWYFLAESEASAERRLAAALAEADRLDPGWRLSDLEARRAAVPEGKNAALVVLTVANLIPADWNEEKFWQLFDEIHLRPECQLEPATARALREGLAKARAAVAEARKLKDMPAGRFPCPAGQWPPFHHGHAQVRSVASLLEHAALLRIEEPSGMFTADIQDFWRPNYLTTALVDGQESISAYLQAVEGAWKDYTERGGSPLGEFSAFCCHQPFTKMAYKAHRHLLHYCGQEVDEAEVTRAIRHTTAYNAVIGNSYTASMYLALATLLDDGEGRPVQQAAKRVTDVIDQMREHRVVLRARSRQESPKQSPCHSRPRATP